MTNRLTPTEIPDSHVAFAKEVADSARKYGIEKFTVEYKPEFDLKNTELTFWGTLKIHFSSADGRGRPANNLRISYETNLQHVISSTPESCS